MPYEIGKVMREKAARTLDRLREAIYRPVAHLAVEAWVTKEPVPYAERTSGTRLGLKPGDRWGELWDCAWFRFSGMVPYEAAGRKVVLLIDVNGELCLVDGEGTPVQGLTNVNSEFDYELGLPGKRVVDVTERAAGGEVLDLWADAGCNDLFGRYRSGTLKEADIAICDEAVRKLYYDFEVLLELAARVPAGGSRQARIERKLYEAANVLAVIDEETVRRASELLAPELERRGGDAELRVSAVGHAHIDLAWLWPIRETIRKGARTFSTALRNLEKYPDYVFGASQPQLYQWMKEHYPKLYERVKEKVREGRWEPQGAMWVEPDTNLSGGEALVRQILYGKRFFREEFGADVRVLWLPDVFGYAGSLPQLLKLSGVDYMMTQKLSWNVYNKHPHHSFVWEGIDGTGVLTHLPPEDTYNSPAAPRSLAKIEREYLDKGVSDHALMLFGIGDGGGGPGEEHLERLARERDLSGLPPVVQEPSIAFFRRLERESASFQRFRGELYLEKHQGTLTSQARNKRYNRQMELALREAEFAASLALAVGADRKGDGADGKAGGRAGGRAGGGAGENSGWNGYPAEALERIWKETLLYQFHDILPGSSIGRVYDESLERYAALLAETRELQRAAYGEAAARIAGPGVPVVFNSLPWEREDWVEWNGERRLVRVPGMGAAALADAAARPAGDGVEELRAGGAMLENGRLRVAFAEDGSLASVYDKAAGREALRPGGVGGNVLTVYHDDGDAWDFPRDYREAVAGRMRLESVEYAVRGCRAVAEQTYRFGESTLKLTVSLAAGGDIVEFAADADWRESAKMLRTSFDTSVVSDTVNCEIQFGYLKRRTTRNTLEEMARDEICAHRYIDLSQPDYGVALLNDCKYGHRAEGSTLDLNLLRSPSYPDPQADRARHEFRYALLPHEGDFVAAGVVRRGWELNVPLVVAEGRTGGEPAAAAVAGRRLEWIAIDHPHVLIEAVKKAEDGDDAIVRLYESAGASAKARISFGLPCAEAWETNLMEEDASPLALTEGGVELAFRPFEIKTIRLKRY
ncbi:alpha-mannosidase [Cohnella xylanilytica]|uniref:alpha-mannosidase n=1 Tax=Cohnella xylanilytica TaxID=557555 RepID=UPI001B114752|nr:glycoside hydrolase family 38 C-terminal domain-containing protein [Cohnella xylanilytica]GIO11360.1 alpha-mannosidase [Cohnella xylanilytica]